MHLVWQLQQLQFYCAAGLLCYQGKIGCRLYSRDLLLSSPKPRGSVPAEPRHICRHIQIIDPWGSQGIAECLLWYLLSHKFLNSVPSQHTCAYAVWRVSRSVRTRLITLLWNANEVSKSQWRAHNKNEPTCNLMFCLFPGVIGPFIVEKSSMACISRRLRKTGTGPFMRVWLKTPGLQKPRLVRTPPSCCTQRQRCCTILSRYKVQRRQI